METKFSIPLTPVEAVLTEAKPRSREGFFLSVGGEEDESWRSGGGQDVEYVGRSTFTTFAGELRVRFPAMRFPPGSGKGSVVSAALLSAVLITNIVSVQFSVGIVVLSAFLFSHRASSI